jgi:ATP-binding cassette subfamily F protein uup
MAAPNLVNLERVTVAHGARTLLDDVSLGLAADDRVGAVGRNGGGKTTLLRTLTGVEPALSGRVSSARDLRVGVLSQDVRVDPALSVRAAVVGHSEEHTWAGDARVRAVLDGLGLHQFGAGAGGGRGLDAVVGTMSGGERRRVALAALLVQEWDLLVLDEPTNHLDVEGVAWLAQHLRERRGAHVVVTHDRWFLDDVCTTTWEVHDGAVDTYDGGYSAYVLARAERARQAAAADQRRQNLLRKELAWLRRGPPARTSKPRFRIEAANALIADEPPARDDVALQRFAAARLGRQVYDVEDVSLAYGSRVLLDDVTWRVGPGDRVGVVGVNGAGKSTLLRLLVGEVQPDAGAVQVGRTVVPAYLSQEVSELAAGLRVLEAVEDVARQVDLGGTTVSASALCERFGFVGEAQWTRVGDLSGGERRRLQLLRLLMGEPNVLLLDEPTNDLDIDTLTALEDVLDGWPGTLLVVSHDRYFLERVTTTTVALLGDGSLAELPGGVDEYLGRRAAVTSATPVVSSSRPKGDTRAAKKELTRLERELARLEREERRLHEQLAAKATDADAVLALDGDLRAVHDRKAAVEDAWLELSEQV